MEAANFVIEKNIPIPNIGGATSEEVRTAVMLDVGDSFVFPRKREASVRASLSAARKRGDTPGKFTFRSIDQKTTRIWRVS